MLASLLEKKIKKLDIHYGWVIMVITFLTSVFSSAAISAPQVLMLPIIKALNWNISDEGGLIDWIEDVQQKTKAWTDEMWDDGEGQEKYFDKPIIGPMEKAFEKYFKKLGYRTEIVS